MVVKAEGMFFGFENFYQLYFDQLWSNALINAIENNLVFFVIHMTIQNIIGLCLAALVLQCSPKTRQVYLSILFLPTTLSVVIVAFIWQLLLNPVWGVPKFVLAPLGLGSIVRPWLREKSSALVAISLVSVWSYVGVPLLLCYSALLNISSDIISAAKLDGASGLKIFFSIQLPIIAPTLGLIGILTYVGNMNAFDLIYTVYGPLGGPNFSTDLLSTLFYRTYFGHQLQLGNPQMGAAIATTILFLVLFGLVVYVYAFKSYILTRVR